jgi:hypothetical protein
MGLIVWRWGIHALSGGRIAMLHDGAATKIELIEVARLDGRLAHIAFASDDVAADCLVAVGRGATCVAAPFRIEAAAATSALLTGAGAGSILAQLIQYDPGSTDLDPWGPG